MRSTANAGDSPPPVAPLRLGRFVILDPLGAGGMGAVYSAWDRQLERRVAIKILHGHDPERFLREAQALARLSHPNVVTVYDVGAEDGQEFIAMELIEGQSLRRWLAARRRPWREVLGAFLAAGRGLAAVHDMGLVHRDFKPDNVLYARDGRVRVADFGLARAAGDTALERGGASLLTTPVTHAGAVAGTPGYMAPEQEAGAVPAASADVYSFCVALWEGLYGRRPGVRETTGRPALGRIPGALRQAVERGLAVEPEARFASMHALLARLQATASRRRWLALAAAVAVAVPTAAFAVARRPAPSCGDAAAFTSGWRESDRAALRDAFARTGVPGAAAAARETVAALDGYVASIADMAGDSCAATRIDRTQSASVLALRDACLRGRFAAARALAGELDRPDARLVRAAVSAVTDLAPVAGCADVASLAAPTSVPADPALRPAAAAVQAELAALEGVKLAGRYREGLPRILAATAAARGLGFRPLLADCLQLLGWFRVRLDDLGAAEPTFEEAVAVAQASAHDLALARAATQLTYVTSYDGRRAAEARRWERLASATLDRYQLGRAGDTLEIVSLRARLETLLADLERTVGRLDEAERRARRAVALTRSLDPGLRAATEAGRALAAVLLQRGRLAEAEEAVRVVIAGKTLSRAAGDELAPPLLLLAIIHREERRWEEARAETERAVAAERDSVAGDALFMARAENNLGAIDHGQGRDGAALEEHRRARAIYEERLGPESPKVAATLRYEAAALAGLGREGEARAALARAGIIEAAAAGER
jgi:eukaryotic-like serine/threonine-protein kinase